MKQNVNNQSPLKLACLKAYFEKPGRPLLHLKPVLGNIT